MNATVITSDRYIVKSISNGIALVLQASGLCIPCKWHTEHQRLESVAINATPESNVPAMYSLNASVQKACRENGWMAMSLDECAHEVDHF